MSADTQTGEGQAETGATDGLCDYCGKRGPVARLDDRDYVACAPCTTEIHCYQAVTDVDAVAPETPEERARRRRGAVAAKRRKWLGRLGEAIDHTGAGRLAVVEIPEAPPEPRRKPAPFESAPPPI